MTFASPWGREKVLMVETWFAIANLLAFEFALSPAGTAVEAGVGRGCERTARRQPLLSDRQICSLFCT